MHVIYCGTLHQRMKNIEKSEGFLNLLLSLLAVLEVLTVMNATQMTAIQPTNCENLPRWKGPFLNVLLPNVSRQRIGIA